MSATFYIVRHGQSEGNVAGDIMGGDPKLTEKGLEQAQALSKLLSEISIDQIFSSDLVRAKQTAEIVALGKKLEAKQDKRVKERSFGNLEGETAAYFSENYKKEIEKFREDSLVNQLNWTIAPGMESLNQILNRALPFFDDLENSYQNQTILLVTHANVMLALLAHFSFIENFRQLPYGSIQNTAYIKVEKQGKNFKISEAFGITKKV